MSAKTKTKPKASMPTCCFCGRSGDGVLFSIFTPRFKPFGTACTDCESTLPAGTVVPAATGGEK